eukprot:1681166-Rhodomonas_salina.1
MPGTDVAYDASPRRGASYAMRGTDAVGVQYHVCEVQLILTKFAKLKVASRSLTPPPSSPSSLLPRPFLSPPSFPPSPSLHPSTSPSDSRSFRSRPSQRCPVYPCRWCAMRGTDLAHGGPRVTRGTSGTSTSATFAPSDHRFAPRGHLLAPRGHLLAPRDHCFLLGVRSSSCEGALLRTASHVTEIRPLGAALGRLLPDGRGAGFVEGGRKGEGEGGRKGHERQRGQGAGTEQPESVQSLSWAVRHAAAAELVHCHPCAPPSR